MTNEHGEALATYYGAFEALADALVAMYNACEATGANLPEALSAALADAAGESFIALGRRYGVHYSTISRLVKDAPSRS